MKSKLILFHKKSINFLKIWTCELVDFLKLNIVYMNEIYHEHDKCLYKASISNPPEIGRKSVLKIKLF